MTTPGQDAIEYVYENVSQFLLGWVTGMIRYAGSEVRRPRDAVEYLYENVT